MNHDTRLKERKCGVSASINIIQEKMDSLSSQTKRILGIVLAVCVIVTAGCGVFFLNGTPVTESVESGEVSSDPEGLVSENETEPALPSQETENLEDEIGDTTEQQNSVSQLSSKTSAVSGSNSSASQTSSQNTSGSTSQPETPKPPSTPVQSEDETLKMLQDELTLEVGMTSQLLTEESVPENVNWQNSSESVASVSELGTVTALAPGETRITAIRDDVQTSCTVVVTAPDVNLNITQLSLQPNQTKSLVLQGTAQTPTWYSSETAVATVDEKGLVQAVGYGRSVIYAQIAEQSFACEVRCVPADTDNETPLTRGEWISDLLTYLEIPVLTEEDLTVPGAGDEGNTTYYYCDTQGAPYGLEAETALMTGILPMDEDEQDVPAFVSDAPATREFAAVTLIRAAGFSVEGIDPLDCTDEEQLHYPQYAALAVQQGFLNLMEDGGFYPQDNIYREQESVFWDILDTLENSTQVTETVEEIHYAADTIVLEESENADYTLEPVEGGEGTYRVTLYNWSDSVYTGNILVLPVSEAYPGGFAIKVTEILERGSNYITAEGVVPQELSDVVQSLHFEGVGTADVNNIEKLLVDEQLTISYDPSGTIDAQEATGYARAAVARTNSRVSVAVPGKLTFDFGDGVKLGDKGKLEGSVEITIPNVTAILDVDASLFSGIQLKEATFSVTEKAAVKGKVSYTVTESATTANGTNEKLADSIELGRIPIRFGANPFTVDLVFSIYWDVNGKVEIIYTVEATQGFQIKDGIYRDLKNVTQDLELPNIEGSAEVGIKGAVNLTFCSIWDLLGADMRVGPKASVSLQVKETKNLICLNGAIFLAGKVELNPDTIAGELLKNVWHYTLEHEFWNQYNSPFSKYIHAESPINPLGFHLVSCCTDEAGNIEGYVFDENSGPVKDARIIVTEKGGNHAEMGTIYTDGNGHYSVNNLPEGQYTLRISKDGYQTFSAEATVNSGASTQMDNITLVRRNQQGEGVVSGTAVNALTGNTLDEVSYIAYTGYNITDESAIVARGTVPGNYEIFLPAGNYTLEFFADRYANTIINVAVSVGHTVTGNVVLSPESAEIGASNIRIVLTWGSQPRDLDSHLFGPGGNGSVFHTYYAQKNYGNIAGLDRDDTTSYGPETTTVYQISRTGVYSFYVHDFTNRSASDSTALSDSGAKVEIYFNNQLYAQLNVPSNQGGTVWHVFDYDAQSDKFQVVNTMYYSSDPGSLGIQRDLMQVKDGESVSEQEALTAISRCEDKIPEEDETPVSTTQQEEDEAPAPITQQEEDETPNQTAQAEEDGNKLIADPAEED